ncbi:MAG: argininosuccinate synthase [Alphaproteobacteria bacterium]|nr:argininosuccinate synthase [Alphaproteobacteria bacterium]
MSKPRLLLSFSGGLDTSFCVVHLGERYEITTVTFDCGGLDDDERAAIAARSAECGAVAHHLVDLRDELCERILTPLIRTGFLKGENYPLCVGSERGLQAAGLAKMANAEGFDAVGHGCTAAGNDQVRFDVTLRAMLDPGIVIEAPIRDLGPTRAESAEALRAVGIAVEAKTTTYSINTSLWGTTLGGGPLHDPAKPVPTDLRHRVKAPADVTDADVVVRIGFEHGRPVSVDGVAMAMPALIEHLNAVGAAHGLGREVHTGDTVLGIKGRIVFEAPAAFLIHRAHLELDKLTLSKHQLYLREHLKPLYGQLLHEGLWLDAVMADIGAYFASEQQIVQGEVALRLGKGTCELVTVDAPHSRMKGKARYGETGAGWTGRDTEGFSKILTLGLLR